MLRGSAGKEHGGMLHNNIYFLRILILICIGNMLVERGESSDVMMVVFRGRRGSVSHFVPVIPDITHPMLSVIL